MLTSEQKNKVGNLLIEKAKAFAERCHSGQFRKYTQDPYFVHPERVANRVKFYSGKPEVVAAAYLHDVVEDCEVSYADINREFGAAVADLVLELSNPSKYLPNLKRAARKEVDRNHLSECSADAQLIKCIDRLDNLNDMAGSGDDFLKLYKMESILLAKVLRKAPQGLVEELVREATLEKPR